MCRVDLGKIDPTQLGALIDTAKVTRPDAKKVETRAKTRINELKKDPYAAMPGKEGTCNGTDC